MALRKPPKPDLADYEIPAHKRRRGSYVIRMALRRATVRQNRHALKAAARMVLALPVVQALLLVAVLNSEWWLGLLALEGLLIAWLAAAQLARPHPESKLLGYGIAFFNAVLLGVSGVFLGSHVFWVTGVLALIPISWLVFARTGRGTVKRAWFAFVVPLVLLILGGVAGRAALWMSEGETDPEARLVQLRVAELALEFRGGNGTERALIGLRKAQAAFQAGDYEEAFHIADRTLYGRGGRVPGVPESSIGADLLDSLMRVKAQSFYNMAWGKDDEIFTPIKYEPLSEETLDAVKAHWAW